MIKSKHLKQALIKMLKKGQDPDEVASACISYLTESGQLHLLPSVLHHLKLAGLEEEKKQTLRIESAFPLSEEIVESLKKQLGAPNAKAETAIVAGLIGGLVARHDDSVIDMSLKSQLTTLHTHLIA